MSSAVLVRVSIIFRETTRNHTAAPYFSYKNIESSMYRARLEVEPPIPTNAGDFIQIFPQLFLQHIIDILYSSPLTVLLTMERYFLREDGT